MFGKYFARSATAFIENEDLNAKFEISQKNATSASKFVGQVKFNKLRNTSVGLHLYKDGDISDNCTHLSNLYYMKPENKSNPSFGNLGNLNIDENGQASIDMTVPSITLYGDFSCLGFSIAIHADADGLDYDHIEEFPLRRKLGCGVFGIKKFDPLEIKSIYFRNNVYDL